MLRRMGIVSGVAWLLVGVACEEGTEPIPGPPGEAGAGAGGGEGGRGVVVAGSTGSSGAATTTAAGSGPTLPACGQFAVQSDLTYSTATLRGATWSEANGESTINHALSSDGAAICARGEVVRPSGGYAWAILEFSPDGVLRGSADPPRQVWTSFVPSSDGLLVEIEKLTDTTLRVCLQTTDFMQYCASYSSGRVLMPWSDFVDQRGSGRTYAGEPIYSFQFTVPDQGPGVVPFDFCVRELVEAASWCECPEGNCDCPGGSEACAASCVPELDINPDHCGGCDVACGASAACQSGQCSQPFISDLVWPEFLSVDEGYLYFTEAGAGTVSRVSLSGGSPEVLASEQANPNQVVALGGEVYWVDSGEPDENYDYVDGAIMTLVDGLPTPLATGQYNVVGLTVDGSSLYWTNYGTGPLEYRNGAVMMLDLLSAGAAAAPLVSGRARPRSIVVDAGNAYWTEQGTSWWGNPQTDGQVVKLTLGSATPEPIAETLSSPMDIAADSSNVYFTTADGIYAVSLASGELSVLAGDQSQPRFLVANGGRVFWTNLYDGSLASIALDGSESAVMSARGQGYALGLAVQGSDAFWVLQDGTGTGVIVQTAL